MSPRALVLVPSMAALALACRSPAPPKPPPPAPVAPAPAPAPVANADAPPDESESPIPITKDDPSWGSRTALVTIVEFSDFQCPFCGRAVPTLQKVQDQYGPKDVRIVWKHMPLPSHAHARPAAEASQAAFVLGGNEAFWRFHTKAYGGGALPDSFEDWAPAIGVDAKAFKAALEAHRGAEVVEEDVALAGKLDVDGTPAFFINGMELSGAQPFDAMAKVIDLALVQSKAAVDRGVPRDVVYLVASTFNHEKHPKAQVDDDEPPPDTSAWKVPVGKSPVLGPAGALVTIVEFSDFQCPFCARAEPTIKTLRETYGDRVRLVWKNAPLPFHPHAEPAAELALEARAQKGDKGFWEVHDRLFADQQHLGDDDLAAVAKAAGLDVAKATQAIRAHGHKAAILADLDLGDAVGAGGTPTFFINGRKLVGAQPLEAFKVIVDEEEAKAKALVAKGTPAAAVYAELQKTAKEAPAPERKELAADPHAPSRGPVGAPVVIQEFADFQCPFCGRAEGALQEIERTYAGRVRLVWRNLPLAMHPDAELAGEAAMEAYAQGGSAAFWKMHDKLLAAQATEGGLKRPALEAYGKELGLDGKRLAAALDGGTHKAALDADKQAADAAGIEGTPAFVINGYFLSGAQPASRLRRVIELALADAAKAGNGKK